MPNTAKSLGLQKDYLLLIVCVRQQCTKHGLWNQSNNDTDIVEPVSL